VHYAVSLGNTSLLCTGHRVKCPVSSKAEHGASNAVMRVQFAYRALGIALTGWPVSGARRELTSCNLTSAQKWDLCYPDGRVSYTRGYAPQGGLRVPGTGVVIRDSRYKH
jgi:hypothetical protein